MEYKAIKYSGIGIVIFDPVLARDEAELSSKTIYIREHNAIIDLGGIIFTDTLLKTLDKNDIDIKNARILLSHLHEDHVGNLALLSKAIGKKTVAYASKREIARFEKDFGILKENRAKSRIKTGLENRLDFALENMLNEYNKSHCFEDIYSLNFVEKRPVEEISDIMRTYNGNKLIAFEAQSHSVGNIVFFYKSNNLGLVYLADFFGVQSQDVDADERRRNIRLVAKAMSKYTVPLHKLNKYRYVQNKIIRVSGHSKGSK